MLKGHHDFNCNPIAPAGCRVLVHNRPKERGAWEDRGIEGFYISQAPDHYRNFTCYIPSTGGLRVSNTVEFFPQNCKMPYTNSTDIIALMLGELKDLLDGEENSSQVIPPSQLRDDLTEVQSILNSNQHSRAPKTSKGCTQRTQINPDQ